MENSAFESCRSDQFSLAFERPKIVIPVAHPVAPGQGKTIAEAFAMMAEACKTLANAFGGHSDFTITHPVTPAFDAKTVREVVNEFLIAKAKVNRSDRYLRQLRVSLSSFSRGRHRHNISEVALVDVEKWIFGQGWKPKTMRGYLADVSTLFNWAHRRGYVRSNPVKGIELPENIAGKSEHPEIHTPEQVRAVLAAASVNPDVCRMLAVRYFAGVRSAECHRLREENILASGYIEVPAVKAKTRRRRLVKIQPCLAAWLALGGTLRPIRPDTIRSVVRASGVNFPANVTRHSFCSYHLAKFQSASKTALEAGHSEAMLFAHYRELVTFEDAERFWSILPA